MLEDNDALDDALFASKAVITLSSAGKLLRAWATTVRTVALRAAAATLAP